MTSATLSILISALFFQLGDNSWIQREKAHRILVYLAPLVSFEQYEAAFACNDPEIAHRAWKIFQPEHDRRMEYVGRSLRMKFPWLHLNGKYFGEEIDMWRGRAGVPPGGSLAPDYQCYREACKHWVIHQLRKRTPILEVENELVRMEMEERQWKACHDRDR